MGYYRAGAPGDWDLSGEQGAAAGRAISSWLFGYEWNGPHYRGRKKETEMGYYRAGGMPGPLLGLPPYQSDLAPVGGDTVTWGPDKVIRTPAFERGERSYRRMNPLNPRALRRSMRRVQSFARFARKTIQFTQRVKMKKRGKR